MSRRTPSCVSPSFIQLGLSIDEDDADDEKAAEQDLKWDTEEERLINMRENLGKEIERLRTRPRGEKFVKRSKHELKTASGGLQNAKNAMAEAERDVRLSRENLAEAKPNSKDEKMYKQLLFASEGKLQKAEEDMKNAYLTQKNENNNLQN